MFYDHFLDASATIILDFDKNGVLIFQNTEITPPLKELLNLNTGALEPENNYCWGFFMPDSVLLKKLLKMLRFRKDLRNIEPIILHLYSYTTNSAKEAITASTIYNNSPNTIQSNNKLFSSMQIVIRAKSGSFKGFYMLLPNFLENE